jgi:hypothetical protein
MIQDRPSLMWVINLGCIDLNQWYARCDNVDCPDYLHFDLDTGGASFDQVRESALVVHEALETLKMPSFVDVLLRHSCARTPHPKKTRDSPYFSATFGRRFNSVCQHET